MKYLNCANHVKSNNQPETLLTVIDLSGSMLADDIKPTRQEAAIRANEEIVRVKSKNYPNDKIGVIAFQKSAKLALPPTHPSKIKNFRYFINDLALVGGTDFVAPLKLAYNCFFGGSTKIENNLLLKIMSTLFFESAADSKAKPVNTDGSVKRIILLTDGDHLGRGNPIEIATRLKNAGVIIDCIGIGGNPTAVNESLLRKIASQNPDSSFRYCFIGDQQKLLRKYQTLAHHIRAI